MKPYFKSHPFHCFLKTFYTLSNFESTIGDFISMLSDNVILNYTYLCASSRCIFFINKIHMRDFKKHILYHQINVHDPEMYILNHETQMRYSSSIFFSIRFKCATLRCKCVNSNCKCVSLEYKCLTLRCIFINMGIKT